MQHARQVCRDEGLKGPPLIVDTELTHDNTAPIRAQMGALAGTG
jgi:hypothetical protein